MRYLPIFLLFILLFACQDIDDPNVDLRVYASIGDCMPPMPPTTEVDSTAILYTGYLNLRELHMGLIVDYGQSLRIYKGVLRMTLEPGATGRYALRLPMQESTTHIIDVNESETMEGDVYLRQCTSY